MSDGSLGFIGLGGNQPPVEVPCSGCIGVPQVQVKSLRPHPLAWSPACLTMISLPQVRQT